MTNHEILRENDGSEKARRSYCLAAVWRVGDRVATARVLLTFFYYASGIGSR